MKDLKVALFTDSDGLDVLLPVLSEHLVAIVVASEIAVPSSIPSTVEVLVQKRTSDPEYQNFVESFRALNVDVIICCSYSMKIPSEIASLARIEAVNIHGGLLPECRGANILNWVLINDHPKTGSTMHILSEEIDQGDIHFRDEVSIHDTDDALSLRSKLFLLAVDQIQRAKVFWKNGTSVPSYKQNDKLARYYHRRQPEDGLFDWSLSNRQIFNLVRALVRPWPGARFLDTEGHTVILDFYMTIEEIQDLRERQIKSI